MEHIVQFAIGIDDDAIRNRVIESAYKDVVKQLMEEGKKSLGLTGTWAKENWRTLMDDALHDYLNENKDLIINLAAEKLAYSYKHSKAFKEKMGNASI